jgi:hypothetical protein
MFKHIHQRLTQITQKPVMAVFMALVIAMSNVGVETSWAVVPSEQVGSGFVVTEADLAFILQQIKIAERHTRAFRGDTAAVYPTTPSGPPLVPAAPPQPLAERASDPIYCSSMIGSAADQIASPLLSFGLRTVDGSCNNLVTGQAKLGAADQTFPRLTTPNFEKPAEPVPPFPGCTAANSSNYNQSNGCVFDSEPRLISNLIVDQTSTNPAAVEVAGFPVRTQGNVGVAPCDENGNPPPGFETCVPPFQTLFIPNVTTDVGLSPPFNSLFTIFGQFFDHGLDKITNGGNGTVFVPLKADDPLVAGPDHIFGNGDDLPAGQRFMMLTRGKIVDDPVTGIRNALNTDTPFVDQSQTYTSHASHQVFLREYTLVDNKPMSTGKFLSESGDTAGTLATWASIKQQAADKLGLALQDQDIHNIPMLATDPYGNFLPGPNGLPQFVTATGLVEGNLTAAVPTPSNVTRIETAFLNDLAPSSDPGAPGSTKSPDGDSTAQDHFAQPSATEYDDELLDQHFICGDGRCNENIALTAVHQVFHSEHDRLAAEFDTETLLANLSLRTSYQATNCPVGCATNDPGQPITFTYGQRLFQAARFVTEMQYQHLVFEEFARKVQPLINPFTPFAFNQTDVDPAITAEFAHAVYRFGHSMLNDTIPRIYPNKLDNDSIDLFDAFLNPGEFNKGPAGTLNAGEATGALIMGLSDQVGNEIDEFVADTLRNRLLGMPLDLPTLNMTRARSEGIPSLNNVRKQIHAATNDGALTPYGNWFDFGENIKNPTSLVNFIAAYGKHPSITGLDPDGSGPIEAGSVQARRMAADQILNNTILPGPDGFLDDNPATNCNAPNDPVGCDETADNIFAPADSAEFVFSTGPWVNVSGVSMTGLDDVDLWVGGLAEKTELFGGLLGSTFNYVFEKQLTDLQNGDRFYYLARTPGMNLRSQLEGNSFSELVMRNSNAHTLKADPFATADCKFELSQLAGTAADFVTFGQNVADDPDSACDEHALLVRLPDGTIKYRTNNSVDTPGINGQGVYRGADNLAVDFVDRIYGGVDNDTFWGGLGNDIIDGGGGDDFVLGGEGDDIITDFAGADFLKGGPGNDAIDGGPGDDIIASASGKDFTNGGQNINETFSGPDDDFAIAGKGEDAVFGDGGDDWEEGDDQPDLLIGDSSTLFFDDHNRPGHDVMLGQGNDDDYDMEGGDDIGLDGPGIEKVAGASGFDWEIGQSDGTANSQPMFADLALPIVNAPSANETRDRFNEVEALSGWNFNDTLRGDSIVPSQVGGGGFIGCDALDAEGVARIDGLNQLVTPAMLTVDSATVVANSVTNYCLLTGNVWGEGNILLGGAGSDTLEGRGADDIIDGDRYLSVRLSVLNGSDAADGADTVTDASGDEIGSTNLMTGMPVTGNFGAGATGMNLQQAVFAGKVNPGNIKIVREILTPTIAPAAVNGDCASGANAVNCDTALYSGLQSEYTITSNPNGSITVTDLADPANATPIVPAFQRGTDGINDTLWNMEQIQFCDVFDVVNKTCATRSAPISLSAPQAQVTPATVVAFGEQGLNTVSPDQTVTVSNIGFSDLTVSSVAITGDAAFAITGNTCAAVVPRGASCTVSIQFAPTTSGDKTASLNITSNSNNVPGTVKAVQLTGTGTGAIAQVTPATSLVFANQNVGTQSAIQTVTIGNTGNVALTVTGIVLGGTDPADFIRTGNCTTVAPDTSCSFNMRFRPTTAGAKSATLTLNHPNNSNLVATVLNLSGTAVAQAPQLGVAPGALAFGNLQVNSVGLIAVPVTNTGTGTVAMPITVAVTGAGFTRATVGQGAIAPNCGGNVAAGATCNVTVRFAPTAAIGGGVKAGNLAITGAGVTVNKALSGTGTVTANIDSNAVNATGVATAQVINFNVRANDAPANVGTVTPDTTVLPNGFTIVTNGGADASAIVLANNQVSWTLTPVGATATTRAASKRGTYRFDYILTSGTATSTATYTLTVN